MYSLLVSRNIEFYFLNAATCYLCNSTFPLLKLSIFYHILSKVSKMVSRCLMSGGANQDMEIGVLAWKGIHFVEMACITRSVKHQNFHNLHNETSYHAGFLH